MLILGYWTFRPKTDSHAVDPKWLAGVLAVLVVALFAIDQLDVLHTHFDEVAHKFAAGYHEPLTHGFIKFCYKVAVAILLLSYAFSGVKKH